MNGCYNRPPLKVEKRVQDGWHPSGASRMPRMVWIDDPMTKDCQYSVRTVDPKCEGCKWNQNAKA